MPASYDLPRTNQLWDEQDINLYQKLPFYLASLEAKYFPQWNTWQKMFGTVKWQPNMGNIMRGTRLEPSPKGRVMFFPNNITTAPKKDVISVRDYSQEARIKRHLYESPYFNFNPSFADFLKNQIKFAMEDITSQISYGNDVFIRTDIFYKSPYVFISGKPLSAAGDGFDGNELVAAPTADGNDAGNAAASKTTAWLQQAAAYVGNNPGNCGYKVVKKLISIMGEDIQAPCFEGMAAMPKPNETIKGKYVLIGSNEAFEYLSFDQFILDNRPLAMNVLNEEFSGSIGSKLVWKSERFPLRMKADGTFPVPQVMEGNEDAYNYGETVPNPDYVNAPFEWAFILGADAYRSIQVGPPPKEFANQSMSEQKFSKLSWNGEVRLTDDLIINYGENRLDTNKYGEFVQLISDTTHGIIPVNRRFVIPVLYRRTRVSTQ